MPRTPRPLVDAIFISAPDRFEVGPDDHFEVGKVYQMSRASLDRWIGLGRARAVAEDEVRSIMAPPPAPVNPLDHDGDGKPGGSKPAEPGDTVMTPADLLAALDATPPMEFFTFKAEAKKILGDKTPAKKDDIIAALQAAIAAAAPSV